MPKPTRKSKTQSKQKRPRNRTLTAVHDAILHDLVYPAEITGKRIRIKLDGSRLFKVHLDKNQQTLVENKVHSSFVFLFFDLICGCRLGTCFSISLQEINWQRCSL